MQNADLIPHPATPSQAVSRIGVEMGVVADALQVRFRIEGDLGSIVLPAHQAPKRQDELWRHTCCELFVRGEGADYYEFNLAPSTAWAAYRFSGYRTGMSAAEVSGPEITTAVQGEVLELAATVHLRECPGLKGEQRAALACVIEEAGGRVSYWALAHSAARPDFHDPGTFLLPLPSIAPNVHSAVPA